MKIQDIFNKIIESKSGCFSGAGVIFFDGEKILMLKNPNKCWGFPGGKPNGGEEPTVTAVRESVEEIGSCPGKFIREILFKNDSRVFYSFVSKVNEPFKVKLSDEHLDYKWIDYNKLKKMKLQKYIYKSLTKIVQELDDIKNVELM